MLHGMMLMIPAMRRLQRGQAPAPLTLTRLGMVMTLPHRATALTLGTFQVPLITPISPSRHHLTQCLLMLPSLMPSPIIPLRVATISRLTCPSHRCFRMIWNRVATGLTRTLLRKQASSTQTWIGSRHTSPSPLAQTRKHMSRQSFRPIATRRGFGVATRASMFVSFAVL